MFPAQMSEWRPIISGTQSDFEVLVDEAFMTSCRFLLLFSDGGWTTGLNFFMYVHSTRGLRGLVTCSLGTATFLSLSFFVVHDEYLNDV